MPLTTQEEKNVYPCVGETFAYVVLSLRLDFHYMFMTLSIRSQVNRSDDISTISIIGEPLGNTCALCPCQLWPEISIWCHIRADFMTSCTTTNAVNIACHSRNGSKCHSKQAKQAKNRIPLIRCSRTVRPADVHKQRKRHMRFLLISTHVRPKSKRQLVRNPVIVKLTTVEHIRVGICKNWRGKK